MRPYFRASMPSVTAKGYLGFTCPVTDKGRNTMTNIDLDSYRKENPLRYSMIEAQCKRLLQEGTAITKAALASSLPLDFALDDDPFNQIAGAVRQSIDSGSM